MPRPTVVQARLLHPEDLTHVGGRTPALHPGQGHVCAAHYSITGTTSPPPPLRALRSLPATTPQLSEVIP